jgi:Kef-type K+ transport system membrane component KefB
MYGVGFGVLVPIFFVSIGLRFDPAVFARPQTASLVVVFLAAFMLVRGTPALLYRHRLGGPQSLALALFSSSKLPLLVVIAAAAQRAGQMSALTASSLVGAGMVSVVAFPLLGCRLGVAERAPGTRVQTRGRDALSDAGPTRRS